MEPLIKLRIPLSYVITQTFPPFLVADQNGSDAAYQVTIDAVRLYFNGKSIKRKCHCLQSRSFKSTQSSRGKLPCYTDKKASLEVDIFLTVTGDKHVVDVKHLYTMNNGAFVIKAGHFDWEVNVCDLREYTTEIKLIRSNLEKYKLKNIYFFMQYAYTG